MELSIEKIKSQQVWLHRLLINNTSIRTTAYNPPHFLEKINVIPEPGKTVGGIFSFGQDYTNVLIIYTDGTIGNNTPLIPLHITNLIETHFKSIHQPPAEAPKRQSLQTSPEPFAKPLVRQLSYSVQLPSPQ